MAVWGYTVTGMVLSLLLEAIAPGSGLLAQVRSSQQAGGFAQIENTVATGVAFNVSTQTLTSVFVAGQLGDTVSLSALNTAARTSGLAPSAALRSTPSADVATQTAGASPAVMRGAPDLQLGDITILSRGVVSVALRPLDDITNLSLSNSKSGTFVVLAQFN